MDIKIGELKLGLENTQRPEMNQIENQKILKKIMINQKRFSRPKKINTQCNFTPIKGYNVVIPGVRGRTLKNQSGEYTGKAPSWWF